MGINDYIFRNYYNLLISHKLMMTTRRNLRSLSALFERASQAANADTLPALLDGTLALLAQTARAGAGALFLLDGATNELVCQAVWGEIQPEALGHRFPASQGMAGSSLKERTPLLLQDPSSDPSWHAGLEVLSRSARSNVFALSLSLTHGAVGAVVLTDCATPDFQLLSLLASRMATEVDKACRLEAAHQHAERMRSMIDIFEQIGSTLDRDKLLRMMIEYARQVINAEACSLFLVDEVTRENVLHLATNAESELSPEQVRVPPGRGIIGHVVDEGVPVLVPDVSKDERHYRQVDQSSGFVTRAILAVPLRTRTVQLGEERGSISTRLIGGFEAVNKQQGTFDDQDASVLTTLANQAATVLQIADLYGDANNLFLDLIKALAAAIDAKDPYTEGHSQRVSDFSVEIARQVGLPPETVHRVRIGSLLHDVGKIGIPDVILLKPGRLTEDEYGVMKQHPSIGANIMGQVRKLHDELPALSEHHERMDGSGYPLGLKGEHISLMGRIVAVADVFDAMTSDRPYRDGMPVEEVINYMLKQVGSQFDGSCVHALAYLLLHGVVKTQKERL
jgi:HD-GYP domain-containing protein (c-di-GMP phosphodiesterase class II)